MGAVPSTMALSDINVTGGKSSTGTARMPPLVLPSCPAPFESAGFLTCIMKCPADKGFERQGGGAGTNTGFKCAYKANPKYEVTLKTISAVLFAGTTLEELKSGNPKAHADFTEEKERLTNELAVLYANIDKDEKVSSAFKSLQAAENARDTAPDAYQQARVMYYTLLKGEDWKEQERSRIAKAEVDPLIAKYKTNRKAALNQYNNQERTVEVVTGLKDRVLNLKDEMKYSVNTFADQLKKVEDAINVERRARDKPPDVSPWTWLDMLLNITLVVVLVYAVFVIYNKLFKTPSPPQYSVMTSSRG